MDDNSAIYNSRIIKIYLEFLKESYPDIDINSLLEYAEIAKYEVEDSAHWFNQRHVDRFHEILVEKTGNPNIAREAGRYSTSTEALGPIKQYTLGFMNLSSMYLLMGKLYPTMSRGAYDHRIGLDLIISIT